MANISFSNTEVAFKYKSDSELKAAKTVFSLFRYKFIVSFGPTIAEYSLKLGLPVKGLIKKLVFDQFCGGETITECEQTAVKLSQYKVGGILDYSVEGVESEDAYDSNCDEILNTIQKAFEVDTLPFAVFKTTGIGRFDLLQKVQEESNLSVDEKSEYQRFETRFNSICEKAHRLGVCVFVDAEETWIQDTIDAITYRMMAKYNKEKTIVYNTIQCYRTAGLTLAIDALERAKKGGYFLGLKLVRGAYMEKERERAEKNKYDDPINPNKEKTHKMYDDLLRWSVQNKELVSICAGTHNAESCALLVELMEEENIDPSDSRFWFAQLYGMSDQLTFNLAKAGYNAAKYLPYGPVVAVMPYLSRRASENSAVKGQANRELELIGEEIKRRNL